MEDEEIKEALRMLLVEAGAVDDDYDEVARIRTFSEAMLHTTDGGLVITMTSGDEFQLTIKQSN